MGRWEGTIRVTILGGLDLGVFWGSERGYSGHVQNKHQKCGKMGQFWAGFSKWSIWGVKMGATWGHFGAYFGGILGPIWGYFGVILGVFWGPVVTKLVYPRHFKGAFWGCFWGHFWGVFWGWWTQS